MPASNPETSGTQSPQSAKEKAAPTDSKNKASAEAGEKNTGKAASAGDNQGESLFGKQFSEKEQKQLFLYLVIGIVLAELAVTVGAVIYSITNTRVGANGSPEFHFPWLGYSVAVLVAPAVIMLLVHLVNLGFSRPAEGTKDLEGMPGRVRTFYALVHGAPTVILFTAFLLIGAAVYYLDGLMALLLKIGDSFQTIAIWLIAAFAAAWIISYAVRAILHYKSRQMEAEYAFRREVLERTGMVLLDAKHAPTTELRLLPGAPASLPENLAALPEHSGARPQPPTLAQEDVIDAHAEPLPSTENEQNLPPNPQNPPATTDTSEKPNSRDTPK